MLFLASSIMCVMLKSFPNFEWIFWTKSCKNKRRIDQFYSRMRVFVCFNSAHDCNETSMFGFVSVFFSSPVPPLLRLVVYYVNIRYCDEMHHIQLLFVCYLCANTKYCRSRRSDNIVISSKTSADNNFPFIRNPWLSSYNNEMAKMRFGKNCGFCQFGKE